MEFSRLAPLSVSRGLPVGQFEIGSHRNFVYLILDWDTFGAWVIDPQSDLQPLEKVFKDHSFSLQGILLTHTHFDHIAGVPHLLMKNPNLPIWVHTKDFHRLKAITEKTSAIRFLQDGQKLSLGSLILHVIHTPGHSSGECCFLLLNEKINYLFTGDTLFIRDCGRTDLETGSNKEMFRSLQKLRRLPGRSLILPGHHYQPEFHSTLETELSESPPFQCKTVDQLRDLP